MKIFVAKTLIEGRRQSNCTVKLFTDFEECRKYASNQIEVYADTNGGTVTLRTDTHYEMCSQDIKVTIRIEEHKV